MELSRRELIMAATAAAAATGVCAGQGLASEAVEGGTETGTKGVVDAGPIAAFGEDRVYDQFREQGFFLVRRGRRIFALSSVCTHKGCKVRPQPDNTFFCRCHKSAFDAEGRVVGGPAHRPLPRLSVKLSDGQQVLVNLDRPISG